MYVVHDFSHLTSEEARKKVAYLQQRIFVEQYHAGMFIRDVRSDVMLKNEIHAYLLGTIQEFHGFSDPIGQLKDWFEDFFNDIFSWFWENVFQPGISAIVSAFEWIWDATKSAAESAVSWIQDVYNIVQSIYTQVYNTITQTLTNVWNTVKDLPSTLQGWWDSLVSAFNDMKNSVSTWWETLGDKLSGALESAFGVLKDIGRWIWDNVLKPPAEAVYNFFSSAWENAKELWDDFITFIKSIPEKVSNAISAGWESLKDFAHWVWDDVLVPAGQGLKESITTLMQQIGNSLHEAFSAFVNTILSLGKMNPLKAKDNMGMIMKLALSAALGLGTATVLGELLHPLKEVGLGNVAAMIYKATNYDIITGAVVGALATAAFSQPLKYAFNAHFQPYLPAWRDVMELRSRRKIDDKTFEEMMHYHGYPDELKKYFDELANTKLSYFALNAIAKLGYYDEKIFKQELLRAGYSDEAINLLMMMYQQTSLEAAKGAYSSVAIARFREGITTVKGLEHELKMLGYPERQITQFKTGAQLYYDLDIVEDKISSIRSAYRRGKITLEQMKAELSKLNLRSDYIKEIAEAEYLRQGADNVMTESEDVRSYGKSTVIKRYKEGLITDSEFENELKILGYSQQWITVLKTVARLERDYDYAMSVLSAAKTAYYKGLINDTKFIELLRSFGFVDEKIQLELNLLKLRYGIGLGGEEAS